MVKYMKNKIKYIDGKFCDTINEIYLDNGWKVISIHPVSTYNTIGCYVLMEKKTAATDTPIDMTGANVTEDMLNFWDK